PFRGHPQAGLARATAALAESLRTLPRFENQSISGNGEWRPNLKMQAADPPGASTRPHPTLARFAGGEYGSGAPAPVAPWRRSNMAGSPLRGACSDGLESQVLPVAPPRRER